jgi:hypothetical protein
VADDISYQAVGELCDVARADGVTTERARWERAIEASKIQFVRPGTATGRRMTKWSMWSR